MGAMPGTRPSRTSRDGAAAMLQKFQGYVLQYQALSDHRFIVALFTESGGRRKGVFRVSKSQPRAYLTPMTLLGFQLSGKEQQELKSMSQVSLEAHYFDLAAHYTGLLLIQHWAFLIGQSQPEEQEDPRVYRLLTHCLQQAAKPGEVEILAACNLYFETWLLHFCGVLARPARDAQTPDAKTHPAPVSDEARLGKSLDRDELRRVFQQRVEDFVQDALQLGSLAETQEVLGKIWQHFLGRDLRIRRLFTARLEERQPR